MIFSFLFLCSVTTCAPCADLAFAIEDDVQKLVNRNRKTNNDNETNDIDDDEELRHFDKNYEMEFCSWCGSGDNNGDQGPLFLCDRCPRAFCENCMTIAHGGGTRSSHIVKSIQEDDKDWSCLYCKPTPIMEVMKKWLWKVSSGDNKISSFLERISDDASNGSNKDRDSDDDTAMLLEQLEMAEDKKAEAEAMQEYDSERKHWGEIEKEVKELNLDEAAAKEFIQNEFDIWKQKWQDQHDRCSDKIGILSDLLDRKNIDLQKFYEQRDSRLGEKYVISDELDAIVRDVLKRQDEERGFQNMDANGFDHGAVCEMDLEDLTFEELEEIDEINSVQEVIDRMKKTAQKKNKIDFSQTFLNKALPNENVFLKSRRVDVRLRNFTESRDQTIDHDDEEYSKQGGNRMIVTRETKRLNEIMNRKRKRSISPSVATPSKRHSTLKASYPSKNKTLIAPQTISPTPVKKQGKVYQNGDNYSCFDNDICVLAQLPMAGESNEKEEFRNQIAVAKPLAIVLKDHQKNGVKFMWDNVCSDMIETISSAKKDDDTVKGCVLAHSMGLGKSVQTISLVHTLLTHPLLRLNENQIIKRVLLLVPVNTLANWQAEFARWCGEFGDWDAEFAKTCGKDIPSFCLYNYNEVNDAKTRRMLVANWYARGGVICCSFKTFYHALKNGDDTLKKYFLKPGPDRKSYSN